MRPGVEFRQTPSYFGTHSLVDAAVKFLRGPETDDGVDDGGRVD